MKINNHKIILIFILIFMGFGCDLINPEEPIPSYIYIKNIMLESNSSSQGINSHKITDIWINIDNSFNGIYELPALFPVLYEGEKKVFSEAGIYNNGIRADRKKYFFYTGHESSLNFIPAQTETLTPVVRYIDQTIFEYLEDFESPGISLEFTDSSVLKDFKFSDNTNVFLSGIKSLLLLLDNQNNSFDLMNTEGWKLPKRNTIFYMEFDYKNNMEFQVGYIAENSSGSKRVVKLNILPKVSWNKIYIELTKEINLEPEGTLFKLYFHGEKPDSITPGEINLDNIKFIHN